MALGVSAIAFPAVDVYEFGGRLLALEPAVTYLVVLIRPNRLRTARTYRTRERGLSIL
jgi:hypothetical protein